MADFIGPYGKHALKTCNWHWLESTDGRSLWCTLNSKRKYTLLDLLSTQRVTDLRWILGVPNIPCEVGQTVLDFKGSFLLSTHKITKCILSFGVECILTFSERIVIWYWQTSMDTWYKYTCTLEYGVHKLYEGGVCVVSNIPKKPRGQSQTNFLFSFLSNVHSRLWPVLHQPEDHEKWGMYTER